MARAIQFTNLKAVNDRTATFTLSPIHVSYANTLRRLILTGVETVSFRADMTSVGTTTDVVVKRNDTPMTNEMLAARIGLLPLHVTEPLTWKEDEYQFYLSVEGSPDEIRHVTASDFTVKRLTQPQPQQPEDEKEAAVVEPESESADRFFPPHPLTRQTCLLASLPPGTGSSLAHIELVAKATRGTGREHARFIPVSQCTYEYTPDDDPQRIQALMEHWLVHTKKAGGVERGSERFAALEREYRTMEIKRCYKINATGEPYSYDFTIESVGVLTPQYIVKRACEVGENMCSRYVNLQTGALPAEITIRHADCRMVGYDFLFRGHDHTLGNLLQTWLVEHHVQGQAAPKITYAGFSVPHPLRDEMVIRIGVEDGKESTARAAIAAAARGCVGLFQAMRQAWAASTAATGAPASTGVPAKSVGRIPRPVNPAAALRAKQARAAKAAQAAQASAAPAI